MELHRQYTNQWAKIAKEMPGRTADAVKSKHISIIRRRRKDLGLRRSPSKAHIHGMFAETGGQRKRKNQPVQSRDYPHLLNQDLHSHHPMESPPKRHHSPVALPAQIPLDTPSSHFTDEGWSAAVARAAKVQVDTDMMCDTLNSLDVGGLASSNSGGGDSGGDGSNANSCDGGAGSGGYAQLARKPSHSLDLGEVEDEEWLRHMEAYTVLSPPRMMQGETTHHHHHHHHPHAMGTMCETGGIHTSCLPALNGEYTATNNNNSHTAACVSSSSSIGHGPSDHHHHGGGAHQHQHQHQQTTLRSKVDLRVATAEVSDIVADALLLVGSGSPSRAGAGAPGYGGGAVTVASKAGLHCPGANHQYHHAAPPPSAPPSSSSSYLPAVPVPVSTVKSERATTAASAAAPQPGSFLSMLTDQAVQPLLLSDDFPLCTSRP